MRLASAPGRLQSAPPRVARAPKVALPFYQSPEWRELKASVIRERGKRCEAKGCGAVGFVIADHIVEIRDGGAKLDRLNIKLLCAKCHRRKTAKAKRARLGLS